MSSKLTLISLLLALTACTTAGSITPTTPVSSTGVVVTQAPPTTATLLPSPTAALLPTAPLVPSATDRLMPITRPFEATATVSPTPYPALHSPGPYLAYIVRDGAKMSLVIMAQDGSGRRLLPLPQGSFIRKLSSAISPDNHWLAFQTSQGFIQPIAWNADLSDLTLNIMSLSDGSIQTIAQLVSKDYPANFQKTAGYIVNTLRPSYIPDISEIPYQLEATFRYGITALQWSSNGRYLAFAGEMDGPSSDLYLYDIQAMHVTRLSYEPEEIEDIAWSPGANQIHYWGKFFEDIPCDTHYQFSLQNFSAKQLNIDCYSDGGGDTQQVNIKGWPPNVAGAVVVDAQTGLTLLALDENTLFPDGYTTGAYLVDPKAETYQKVVDNATGILMVWDSSLYRFIASTKQGMFAIDSHGGVRHLTDSQLFTASQSPDKQWLTLYGNGIELFNANGESQANYHHLLVRDVQWLPDSSGMLLATETGLYLWRLGEPAPRLVPLTPKGSVQVIGAMIWNQSDSGLFIGSDHGLYFIDIKSVDDSIRLESAPYDYNFDYTWLTPP
jgi:hypothetical protein